ncbi:DUF4279 domain-containing protein [Extibacter muris]|uniref:DUF4279 domain-containing protein n=1 Tax=Extibacter muris TaxID=1796622 RepID=UPI001D05D20F|nr:DUF4279 domain-containing protein [Extibacter muris]MCB6200463.1 DUF4279 domain-containing protein [Extibacter muris]MCQ4663426.1 DUF4279 domain-containing protein [Extibacter muris]MCQ4692850.1 DUF4279 domain-containing protein [Extibacter muris]
MQNQNMPLISVGFCIESKSANLRKISEVLDLIPTRSRRKSEWPQPSIDAGIACDSWELSTEQSTSMSVDTECKKLIDMLKGKENSILSLCEEYQMDVHVQVVIHMNNNRTPAIFVEKETVTFLAMVNADIGFDIYTYDEEDEE